MSATRDSISDIWAIGPRSTGKATGPCESISEFRRNRIIGCS